MIIDPPYGRRDRYLVVNADDFGQSPGVNHGIIRSHEHGIVTSASLMVRWPAAAEAAGYARTHPCLSLGLHVDLGEWRFQGESWGPLYEVVPAGDSEAVLDEVSRQLELFRRLAGRDPTHIDSHQHVHRSEPLRAILIEVARALAVPLREFNADVRYCGDFYGQTGQGLPNHDAISATRLIAFVAALPPGVTELGCHPGEGGDVNSMYQSEREKEVAALCDPRVRAAITAENIELCSFADLPRVRACLGNSNN
ncbi:MAG: ChbG/HpnK family deacetylase [Acidobacteria bacterium]|nr:ChbG/HpnK family deacetylase [Acidobacteriota bacterium]